MKTGIQAAFGKAVRQARQKKGWSQEELAYRANLHRTYVGSIERGERNVALENIVALADVLGMKAFELLRRASL
jgi:transcriptional regulator with XRE-family HTH domain